MNVLVLGPQGSGKGTQAKSVARDHDLPHVSTGEMFLAPEWPLTSGLFDESPLDNAVAAVARGSFAERMPPAIRGRGYVVDSLEAALWAFARTDTFADGALAAVNLGDDADTTAAIYGQLAGAYYGTAAIPAEWRMRLTKRALIEELAERLVSERPRSPR